MPTRPQPKKSAKPSPDPKNANANKNTQRRHPWPEAFGAIVFGPPGVGKTEFAAQFPSPKFYHDPQEAGIKDLITYGRVPTPEHPPEEIDTFQKMLNIGDIAGRLSKQGVKTVVFDSLTGFEAICFDYHCQMNFNGDRGPEGFLSFNRGPEQAARTDWCQFIQTCQNLIDEDINVVLLAHSQVKTFHNPEGPDFDRYSAFLNKHTWQYTHRWAQLALFYNYSFSMAGKGGTDKDGKEVKQSVLRKGKAKDTSDVARVLYSEWSPAWDAKNRMGLDPAIPAGASGKEAYQNFLDAFQPGVIKK